jgi:hypothetical protein
MDDYIFKKLIIGVMNKISISHKILCFSIILKTQDC